jgi:hypothetical protein
MVDEDQVIDELIALKMTLIGVRNAIERRAPVKQCAGGQSMSGILT